MIKKSSFQKIYIIALNCFSLGLSFLKYVEMLNLLKCWASFAQHQDLVSCLIV